MNKQKYQNMGGSGARHSLTRPYTSWEHKDWAKRNYSEHKLTAEELQQYLSGDKIQCLECGRWYRNVNSHLASSNCISKSDYYKKFGIPINTPLAAEDLRASVGKRTKEAWDNGDIYNYNFQAARERKGNYLKELVDSQCRRCDKSIKVARMVHNCGNGYCEPCKVVNKKEASKRNYQREMKKFQKAICTYCKKEYDKPIKQINANLLNGQRSYCSTKCRGLDKRVAEYKIKACLTCGTEFETALTTKKYCSKPCYDKKRGKK